MPDVANPYCERLGIEVPPLESLAGSGKTKLFHLMVAALLERGGPMSLGELVDRLDDVGVVPPTGDLATSLVKAWHGRDPVYRDAQGNFGINLSAPDLDLFLFMAGLRPARVPLVAHAPVSRLPQRADHEPLTNEEVEAAFRDAGLSALSRQRQAGAVLDALGRPATFDEVNRRLKELTRYADQVTPDGLRCSPVRMIRADGEGRLALDPAAPGLVRMRQIVRAMAHKNDARRAHQEQAEKSFQESERRWADKDKKQKEVAAALRRAVLRVVGRPPDRCAAALLDAQKREIRMFIGDACQGLSEALSGFDLLAGLHIRDDLAAFGVEPDRWRLVDLKPPQKTMRINRAGRLLRITTEMLMRSTTGISRPLGDARRTAAYLERGEHGKLERRLAGDAKAFYAYYRYGALHGFVRLQWGFLDEIVPAAWGVPGGVHVGEILKEAKENGTPVDAVTRWAPSWSEPWARAMRLWVKEVKYWDAVVHDGVSEFEIDLADIQEVRIAGDSRE